MTGGAGGSGGTDFVPASDVKMNELRRKSRVWRHVTQGQRLGIWEKRHACLAGEFERDPVDEVQEFLDEEARRAGGMEVGGGTSTTPDLEGEVVVMTARGSSAAHHHEGDALGRAGKRPVDSGAEGMSQARKRQRQSTLDEVYDPDGQAAFRDSFLQWAYDAGIPFAAFRRQLWYRHKKALAAMLRGVRPIYPSFNDIGVGIDDQRGKVAAVLREVRGLFESVGATILLDGRQLRDTRPIVNFLAAAKRGALMRNALEGMLHDDEWHIIPWESSKRRQALWARQVIRCANFWRNVQHAVTVMTPVHQPLRRLDRGGMIMSMIYSLSQELVRQVAVADVPDDMRGPCVEVVQIRTMHMLEHAHAAAHLLNPRKPSLRYYESVHRTAADLEVVIECDSFLLVQTDSDPAGDTYLRVREQMQSFHARLGYTTDRVTRDANAEACVGDKETSRCASWWVEHDACFSDLQEIAGRMMHMWTSASPAERNWAEHERIHTAKHNKLKFRKVVQLVEIATNLKLLGCSEWSGGYVLPWGHMATLAEAHPEEYTHVVVDDEDEEEEPEPEEWGARPQSAVPAYEIGAQLRRFQQQGSCRPAGVGEVFSARAKTLHPYDYTPPPPAQPAQALEQQSDTDGVEDLSVGVDKSAERLYYTCGGGPDGFQSQCTFIRKSEDNSFPATDSRDANLAERQRTWDLETGAAVPDPSGVEHRDPTVPHPFAHDPVETEEHVDPAVTEHGDPAVAEHGDPTMSDIVLGFCVAGTLEPDHAVPEKAVRTEGDFGEHRDGDRGPSAEADDGADTAG
ncbi:hypothetical protein CBR_g30448 [Chara braunii]|uniref:HAT C-terminal dimerisation domain-containing protein n=1 Tax=Chara braunii TaxID=69332 RepID=A0A388LCN9_CHABU|nr:hypothetical protein CBR_g30448 [Chara braunii]|eukprot:GBG80081.1 hypothetical protein CBR_g30448 [Chara braunii]